MRTSSARRGIYAAAITPLNKDFTIDNAGIAELVSWMCDKGIDGITMLGGTGEATAISHDEKRKY